MTGLVGGKATLCVVNYRTLDLTRLCLRSIRRYTDYPHETLVIDNNSGDASVDYLRGLPWITLVERRPAVPDRSGADAHGAALDMGLGMCRTEFLVAMHSDTVILGPGWLTELVGYLQGDQDAACAGADKIELKPAWQVLLKKAFDLKALQRRLFADGATRKRFKRFCRTICSVYRTEVLRKEQLSFAPDPGRRLTVGQRLYYELQDRGYRTVKVPDRVLRRYVVHLAHATQVVNAEEFAFGRRSASRWHRAVERRLASGPIRAILTDDSLDR
jgi:GT2 family glycosyltransferase